MPVLTHVANSGSKNALPFRKALSFAGKGASPNSLLSASVSSVKFPIEYAGSL